MNQTKKNIKETGSIKNQEKIYTSIHDILQELKKNKHRNFYHSKLTDLSDDDINQANINQDNELKRWLENKKEPVTILID
jgi:hypothetical protein